MHSKECLACHIIKPIEEFAKDKSKSKSDNHRNQCKSCSNLCFKNRHKIAKELHTCLICQLEKPRTEFRYNSLSGLKTECKECEKTQFRCSNCNIIKQHEEFPVCKASSIGRHSWCRKCSNNAVNKKFKDNEEFRKYKKEYARSEKAIETRKKYCERSDIKEKRAEYQRVYSKKRYRDPTNHSKALARNSVAKAVKSGLLFKPIVCQANGKYGDKCNQSPISGHHYLGYAEKHWLEVEWLCHNCHKIANQQQIDNPESITKAPEVDFQAILELYNHSCAYCGKIFDRSRLNDPNELTEDHVIPRSKGGKHSFENIIPSCRTCNVKKHDEILRKPLPNHPVSVDELLREAFPERYIVKELRVITCSNCLIPKELSQAYFRYDLRFGYRSECLECEKSILRCSKCKEIKPHNAFSPDHTMSTGRRSICRKCDQKHQKIARKTDEYKEKRHEYRKLDHVRKTTKEYNQNYQPSVRKIVSEKACTKCKLVKPSDAFGPNKKTSTGLSSWCKECVALKINETRLMNSQNLVSC